MMRFSNVWCLPLLTLVVLSACSKESEPPPSFNSVLSQGSQDLPPVPLARADSEGLPPVSSARYLKKIAGPAGNPADVAIERAGAKPTEAARAVTLNDAEAESLMKQFVELSNGGNLEATAGMFVAEQQPAVRKMAAVVMALDRNLTRLRGLLKDSAPDVVKQLQPDEKGVILVKTDDGAELPLSPLVTLEFVSVTPQGDDKATGVVRSGAQGPEKKFEMERKDGKWRLQDPGMAVPPEQVAMAIMLADATTRAFGEVADKVEKNEVPPADAMKEFPRSLKRWLETLRNAKPEGEGTETTNQTPPADNAATPEPPAQSSANPTPKKTSNRKPGESASGRDVNNEAPTLEESLGRQ